MKNYFEERPWGTFENLLDTDNCKVKKIVVKPGSRLSYQYHHRRSEVWTIVSGTAKVTLDGVNSWRTKGSVIQIPAEIKHRIENDTDEDLIFIEVQWGEYFGEDDIVRLQDDYNRV